MVKTLKKALTKFFGFHFIFQKIFNTFRNITIYVNKK